MMMMIIAIVIVKVILIIIIIIIIIIVIIIAFSRTSRTHPNFVSQAPETESFWTANWPLLKLFAVALGLAFVSTGHVLRSVLAFSVLFDILRLELVFTPIADSTKRKCSPSADSWGWALLTSGEKELNHRKACVYKTICVFDRSRLLVLSSLTLDRAWRVCSGCDNSAFVA